MSLELSYPPLDEDLLRDALVAAGRRLGARGLICAGEGNISVRLGAETMLITPSGPRKDELLAGELLRANVVPGQDAWIAAPYGSPGLRPSSDIAIHRAIYAERLDVEAIVHAHLPASMALTLAGEAPDPGVLPETALLIPRLPVIPFAQPGSEALARDIADAFGDGHEPLLGAVLLERHGAVAVGVSEPRVPDPTARARRAIDQAIDRLELVEVLCRTWRDALLIRAALPEEGGRAILRPPSPSPRTPA